MYQASRSATLLARLLVLALLVPIIVACGGDATTPSASSSTGGGTSAAPSAASPSASEAEESDAASPSASDEESASPSASDEESASPSASDEESASPSASGGAATPPEGAETPINEKQLIIGFNQAPPTLFGIETSASIRRQIDPALGLCVNNADYAYQATYCFAENELPTLDNGGAVTETVQINPDEISAANPIVVDGVIITDTAAAEADGITIPEELPQLSVTYNINPDLRWEDGQPVTSADAAEAFRIADDPATQVPVRRTYDLIQEIQTPDEQTAVQVWVPGYLESDYYALFIGFAPSYKYGDLSIEEIREQESTHPWSFGPFYVTGYNAQQDLTLESNPYFPQQPAVGTVIYKFFAGSDSADQMLAQLQTGDIDYAGSIGLTVAQIPQLDELQAAGTVNYQAPPATTWEHLDFGIDRADDVQPFFDDVRTRQAVGYAINRQQLVDTVLGGNAQIMNTYVPEEHPSYPGDDQLEQYAFDQDRARQLLDEAGWTEGADGVREKDGRRFSFTMYTTSGNALRQSTLELIQADLAAVGIETQIETQAADQFFNEDPSISPLNGRRFDIALYAWGSGVDASHALYRCDGIPTEENGFAGQNYPGYCNEEFDRLSTIAQNEINLERRQELDAAPLILYNQELPSFPLYQRPKLGAFRPAVTGVELDPTSDFDLYNLQEIDVTDQ